MLATRVRKVGKGRGKRWGRRAMYTGDRVRNERRKKDARGRWKRTARSRRSDKDRRHGSKSERGRKKGEEAREKEEKSCAIGWRRKRERESKKKSEVPVSCLLQGSQRHETKGTPPARKEQRR